MWHRADSAPARRDPARREPTRRGADPAPRERVGAHAWVRLPAASDDRPGTARAHDLPTGAVPPGARRPAAGERGARPPDRRVPRTSIP